MPRLSKIYNKTLSFAISSKMQKQMDRLVKNGFYDSKSELTRVAIDELLVSYENAQGYLSSDREEVVYNDKST